MRSPRILPYPRKLAYTSWAGVNPPAGLGGLKNTKAHERPHPIAGAFFVPAMLCYGGLHRDIERCAGVPLSQSANLMQSVTLTCLAASGDGSKIKGTITMHLPLLRLRGLNSSKIRRATAHRKMALAALRSNSSLQNRLKRYNDHIAKARQLEITGGAAWKL